MTQSCYKRKAYPADSAAARVRRANHTYHDHKTADIVAPPIISSPTSQTELVRDGSKLWLNSSIDAMTRTTATAIRNRYRLNAGCEDLANARIAQNASNAYSVK